MGLFRHIHKSSTSFKSFVFQAPSVFQGYPLPHVTQVGARTGSNRALWWAKSWRMARRLLNVAETFWFTKTVQVGVFEVFHFDKNLKGFRIRRLAMINHDHLGCWLPNFSLIFGVLFPKNMHWLIHFGDAISHLVGVYQNVFVFIHFQLSKLFKEDDPLSFILFVYHYRYMGAVRKSRSQIYELMRLLCFARLLKPASR